MSIERFSFPTTVHFGAGARKLVADHLKAQGIARPLLVTDRGVAVLGRRWRWLRPLASRFCQAHAGGPRPRQVVVADFILADAGFRRACERYESEIDIDQLLAERATMSPVAAAATSGWSTARSASPSACSPWDLLRPC